jgi:hypothetical protein
MAALKQYTPRQQKLLFPGGIADDIKTLGKEIQFLYPQIKDPSMAGFTTGTIMQHVWYERFYAQGYYSLMRAFLQKPALIRRLAVGIKDSNTRVATRTALKDMFYYGAMEMNNPGTDPSTMIPERENTNP